MSAKKNCFIPDKLHINERNFISFFNVAKEMKMELVFHDKRRELIASYGKYRHIQSISQLAGLLKGKSQDELFTWSVNGVNLFDCCCSELLSYLMTLPEWYDALMPETREKIFRKAYELNEPDLLANMAAAMDWVNHWTEAIEGYPEFDYCCVFSGSLIYQRSLIELMKTTRTRVFVMESSFTGNDYYCEERYSPIANQSDIRFLSVYNTLQLPEDPSVYERERNKAINKYILSKNKNVQQPDECAALPLDSRFPTVLILGQVLNDFSLIETGVSSVNFYKNAIRELVKHDVNVVFKAHPWEEKKSNVSHPLTYTVLEKFIDSLEPEQRNKVHLIDHYPITELFAKADCVLGINSQSLLESCFFGFKPFQFGRAFFGQKGFTYDMKESLLPEMVGKIAKGQLNTKLSMDELRLFEDFITRFFQRHLVSVHKSGNSRLRQVFAPRAIIPIVDRPTKKKNSMTPLAVIPGKATEQLAPLERKLKKLERDPYAFFRDAKNPLLRQMKFIFAKRG